MQFGFLKNYSVPIYDETWKTILKKKLKIKAKCVWKKIIKKKKKN